MKIKSLVEKMGGVMRGQTKPFDCITKNNVKISRC